MEGKLIKLDEGYVLVDDKSNALGQTFGKFKGKKLSLKNCEVVKNGYDLDELAENYALEVYDKVEPDENYQDYANFNNRKNNFEEGFQKALELLGDKKFQFTKEELVRLLVDFVGFPHPHNEPRGSISERYVQSLQQTEWDVEIEMEEVPNMDYKPSFGGGSDSHYNPMYVSQPKLDAEGCLILKRK